jgi:N-acetylglucosamine-6-phosphate deacetylase
MIAAVRNSMAMMGVSLPQAIQMASCNPAAFLGLSDRTGALLPGRQADFILLDDRYQVLETWIGGQLQAGG